MAQYSTYQNTTLTLSASDQFDSHLGGGIIDILEPNGFKAPFDCILVKKENDAGNTFVFRSKEKVNTPGYGLQYVTFRCTHMNSPELITKTEFSQGEVCYYQGTAGYANGAHIHLQFALGLPVLTNGSYLTQLLSNGMDGYKLIYTDVDNNILMPWDAMYLKNNTSIVMHDGDKDRKADYLWTLLNGNRINGRSLTASSPAESDTIYVYTANLAVNIRAAFNKNATILTTVAQGKYIKLLYIVNQLDDEGFTWGYVNYNGTLGFIQLDTNYYFLSGNDSELDTRVHLTGGAVTMKACPNGYNRNPSVTIPQGASVKILEFLGYTALDNYRWLKVTYNQKIGFIKYDPSKMYITGDVI